MILKMTCNIKTNHPEFNCSLDENPMTNCETQQNK